MPTANNDIFPLKIATGDRFCNRVKERKLLGENVRQSRHTVLVSPRRYGKSSLVHYIISELNLPFASIDLFLAHNDKAIVKRLLTGISEAVSRIMPIETKALDAVKSLFNKFNTSMNFGSFQIELAYERGEIDAVDQVYTALNALAKLADKEKKKVIIFIDEFQDIAVSDSSKSIQGAIRHVAQETSDLMFIFSGSNRHLLLELFDDKSMPLYMLCDKLHLERIKAKDYQAHLQALAKKRWSKELPAMVLARIFTLTELHPFYINFMCNKLWKGHYPENSKAVDECWIQCMEEESRRIRAEIERLGRNQREVLKTLAIYPTSEPTGKDFSYKAQIATSSLHQALKVLFEKDMVFAVKEYDEQVPIMKAGQVRVLDPLISSYLKRYA